MKWIHCLMIVCLWGCGQGPEQRLLIATAANLQFAMREIRDSFTQQSGVLCDLSVSSSGKLTAQIMEGAPYDLFLSADMSHPFQLQELSLTTNSPQIYAYGKLVLWTNQDQFKADIHTLATSSVSHIAVANPEIAPYGHAAFQVIAQNGLSELIKDKLVFGESISQVNQFIIAGAAEVGFTSKSAVLATELSGKGSWTELDSKSYDPIAQGLVILKGGKSSAENRQKFVNFLFSEKGREILQRYGYQVP